MVITFTDLPSPAAKTAGVSAAVREPVPDNSDAVDARSIVPDFRRPDPEKSRRAAANFAKKTTRAKAHDNLDPDAIIQAALTSVDRHAVDPICKFTIPDRFYPATFYYAAIFISTSLRHSREDQFRFEYAVRNAPADSRSFD